MVQLSVPLLGPGQTVQVARALWRSGLVRLYRPDEVVRLVYGLVGYDFGPAAGPFPGRVMYPKEPALIDDDGELTFDELDAACDRVGVGLRDRGVMPGDRLGLLARNSRHLYCAMVGMARAGIDVVYLNWGSSAEQLNAVCRSEGLAAVVHDPTSIERAPDVVPRHDIGELLAEELPACDGPRQRPSRGGHAASHVILTSGTTGRPRGVARSTAGFDAVAAVLTGLPYRVRERHLIAAPGFHAWGWMNLLLTMLLSSTVVTTRRFDAERILALIEAERCEVLVAVPVMLQRLVDLDPAVRRSYDTSSLRVVSISGSALSGTLASTFMDAYGDVLFNLYGSTEAAFATVADPADLRAAPGAAGRPLPGVKVRVVDAQDADLPAGQIGAVVVGSGTTFSSYTSGEDRPRSRAGIQVGDLGRFDQAGRLFIVGRADDLVVTGGENVYPITVEHALERHPDVVEAAVVGVADEEFGEVLQAHVWLRPEAIGQDGESLRTWVKGLLAPFEVPRWIVVHDQPLPRNASGKVLKRELRA